MPSYYPQANLVERSNRTLKTMIAAFVDGNHRNWDAHLHEFRHSINTAMQRSLKTLPAFLNYGRHPRPVKSLRREIEKREPVLRLDPDVWKEPVTRLDALKDLVAKYIDESHAKQSEYYNRGKRIVDYGVEDNVMRRVHTLSNAAQGKTRAEI